MTPQEKLFLQTVGKCVARLYEARIKSLEGKIADLETQFAELPSVSSAYRGVWDELKSYRRGEYVTLDGALWHANCGTMVRPGKNSHWRLAVKSGEAKHMAQPFLDAQKDAVQHDHRTV
jgi:hypothetical protein